jgi:hypothetical protein
VVNPEVRFLLNYSCMHCENRGRTGIKILRNTRAGPAEVLKVRYDSRSRDLVCGTVTNI